MPAASIDAGCVLFSPNPRGIARGDPPLSYAAMDAVNTVRSPPKLDVVRVLLAAAVAPFFHKRTLIVFALPVLAIQLANGFLGPSLALELMGMIAAMVLTVACHRVFVLGPNAVSGYGFKWWAARVARFFGAAFVISLITLVVAIPALFTLLLGAPAEELAAGSAVVPVWTQAAALLLGLPALYVFGRLSLVLPAVATVDGPDDLGGAWSLSSGNGLRVLLVIGPLLALYNLLVSALLVSESPPVQTAVTLVLFYVLLVQVAALSMAYRELKQQSPPQ